MAKSLIKLIKIPKIKDSCMLYFLEQPIIPFNVKRLYFITDADLRLPRGFHAHHKTKQILFCIKGSVRISIVNGYRRDEVVLKSAETGIVLDPMIWHEMHDFKKNTLLLIVASRRYDPLDYIRDHKQFIKLVQEKKGEKNKI